MKTMKKVLATILSAALLVTGLYLVPTEADEVQATDNTTSSNYEVVAKDSVVYDSAGIPILEGYLFAGWFGSETCTLTSATDKTNATHAKFVQEDVLHTKLQISNKAVKDGTVTADRAIRLISSVESLNYSEVGFVVNGEQSKPITIVYERIASTLYETSVVDEVTVEEKLEYTFSPKIVGTKSEYFFTAKLAVSNTATPYTVQAYWKTLDGTIVTGESRCVTVSEDTKTNVINLTVDKELATDGVEYTASFESKANTTVTSVTETSAAVTVLNAENGYSNVRVTLTGENTADAMASATLVTITGSDGSSAIGVYRNYHTSYLDDGVADTSWYDVYSTEDEFVIATNADLYGLATIVDANTDYFLGDTVYVVSDIKANDEDAVNWGTGEVLASPKTWEPIGETTENASAGYIDNLEQPFKGTFDGQGHTISGIYHNSTQTYRGLFAATSSDAIIMNFKLIDSYISGSHMTGAIAAAGNGTFDTIYCATIVRSTGSCVGGLVGRSFNGITVNNCWFAGSVKTTRSSANNPKTGGLVGLIGDEGTIENSLNTGSVEATAGSATTTNVAGLIGYVDAPGVLSITDSFNAGYTYVNTGATAGYGAIVGAIKSGGKVNVYTSYADANTCAYAVGSGTYTLYDKDGNQITENTETSILLSNNSIIGEAAETNLSGLNFESNWSDVAYGTPVLTSFIDEMIDTSWYEGHENDAEYVLYDKADLYGFAVICKDGEDFYQQTIKLGADITLNVGDADTWSTRVPSYRWTTIGTETNKFEGTFNGQMYTISGIYLSTTSTYTGLFGSTSSNARINSFSLKNSYITSTQNIIGSVAGCGRGEFHTIYSSAGVVGGNGWVGGIIGQTASEGAIISNCWFAGSVTNTHATTQSAGGIVGKAYNATISNCLNTGEIDGSASTKSAPVVGGIVGNVQGGYTVNITACFNTGDITVNTAKATNGYGSIVGYANGNAIVSDTYATSESCTNTTKGDTNKVSGTVETYSEEEIKGTDAEKMTALFATGYWVTVTDSTPILSSFAN